MSMKVNEILDTSSLDQLAEKWQDWVMAAGIGSAALGGGSAIHDYYANQKSQEINQTATAPKQDPAQVARNILAKSNNKLEQALVKVAVKSGMSADEIKQFMAQCAHETMDFSTLSEIGSDKYFATKYDKKFSPKKAAILGNKHAGDGVRYKGRGYIQLTGRYNYAKAGEALGLPLEQHPELVERPDIAAKVALWFWNQRVKPRVDDFTHVPKSTKPINPGMKGLDSRQAHYDKYSANAESDHKI